MSLFFCHFSFAQKSSSANGLSKLAQRKGVKFVKAKVIVYEGETLADILRRFVKDDSVIFKDEAMVQKTLKNNPQVKNWRNLKTGEVIKVYLDPKFLDPKKVDKFRNKVKKVAKNIRKNIKKKKKKNEVKKFSVFYMASMGDFAQKNESLAEIEFKQNSPVTLGLMHTYFPKNGDYTIATSAYFSYLLAASTNTEDDNVSLPLEIGLNAYYQYPLYGSGYYLYGGADFEKFNTFNLEGIESNNEISFDENQLLYLTAGFSKTFALFKKKFLFKGSFSHSVVSSRTSGFADETDDAAYSGYKVMGFLLGKVSKSFFLSTLLKYHVLTGPSDVNILRVGVGCGYLF